MTLLVTIAVHFRATSLDRERGAGMAEYGLLVALIAAVIVIAVSIVGTEASTMYSSSGDMIN